MNLNLATCDIQVLPFGMLAKSVSLRNSTFSIKFRQYCNSRNVLIKRLPKPEVPEILTTTSTTYLRQVYEYNPEWEKDDPYAKSLSKPDYFGVMNRYTIRDMMEARVHFGHKVGRQAAAMNEFIFGERLGVSIFDLNKTIPYFNLALNVLAHIAYRGGIILFVTNDKNTTHLVEKTAKECKEYSHCHPWMRGIFLNSQHYFGHLIRHPDAIVLTNCTWRFRMHKVIQEAAKLAIPTFGVIDSDFEFPQSITYPIPGNDDTMESIKFYLKHIKFAILAGKQKRMEEFGPEDTDVNSSKKLFKEILKEKQKIEKEGNAEVLITSGDVSAKLGSVIGTDVNIESEQDLYGDDHELRYFDDESDFETYIAPEKGNEK